MEHSTSGRDARASYRTISVPLGFDPVFAFWSQVSAPVARQGGREISAPGPYMTDLFYSLVSISANL